MFLLHRIRPLVPQKKDKRSVPANGGSPTFWFRSFSPDEIEPLRRRARSLGSTLNDVMLAASFLAMRDCLDDEEFCADSPSSPAALKGYLRLTVPFYLANINDRSLSAANQASMVFLDRTPDKIDASDDFLRRIHREIAYVKKNRLAFTFMYGLKFFKSIFGSFEPLFHAERCWTTGTLSNLGVLNRGSSDKETLTAGNLELLDFYGTPPIRNGSVFGAAFLSYAGRLFLALQYDTKILTRRQAEKLFSRIVQRTLDSGQSGSTAPTEQNPS